MEGIVNTEVGTIAEAKFTIIVKADVPEERILRIHKLTLENCPVGKLFENAGVKTSYNLRVEKE